MKKLLIGILVLALTVSFIGCGKKSEEKDVSNDTTAEETIYKIGETAKVYEFSFTLLDFKYGENSNTYLSREDFKYPGNDATVQYENAKSGEYFVTITYTLEYSGKKNEMINLRRNWTNENRFWFEYQDYNIGDDYEVIGGAYIRNDVAEGTKQDNMYLSLWDLAEKYEFKPPFKTSITVREQIMVPKEVIDDENSSLVLVKNIYSPQDQEYDKEGIVKYKIK